MVLPEWSFGNHLLISIGTTNNPPDASESSPYITLDYVTGVTKTLYWPTNMSINGQSVKGMNEGQATWWMKRGAGWGGVRFFFRTLDAFSKDWTGDPQNGYVLVLDSGGNASMFRRRVNGVSTNLVFFTITFPIAWIQIRVSWWIDNGLNLKLETRSSTTSPWVQAGSTVIDSADAHKDPTNQIAFFQVGGAGLDPINWEGFRISARTG